MEATSQTQQSLQQLCQAFTGRKRLAILTHNNPDPDALASAMALRFLIAQQCHVRPKIYFSGFLSRVENRTMVSLLHIPARRIDPRQPPRPAGWVLVDTQPGATNHSLPPSATLLGAVDHHPVRRATRKLPFSMLDTAVGATSTILTELLAAADLRPSPRLASALFLGIKTDTGNLLRSATGRDLSAFCWLFPRIRPRLVSRIEEAPWDRSHYLMLNRALDHARLHGPVLFTSLGTTRTSEPVAEIADYFARFEEVGWVIVGAWCADDFYISVRSARGRRDAGAVLQKVAGRYGSAGGHKRQAAARLELAERPPPRRKQIQQEVVANLIAVFGGTQVNQPLLGKEAPPGWDNVAEQPVASPGR